MTKMTHVVAYPILFIFVFDQSWQGLVLKFMKKKSFLGIFSRLGFFHSVFGQVRVWFISELHEMMKVSHIVAFPIVFLYFLIGMEDCWNLWKMILFKCFLPLWSVSSRLWASLGANHSLFYKNKESVLCLLSK